jgi:hypothetical protein
MDSTCFIDCVKKVIGTLPEGRNIDEWYCKKLLEAHHYEKKKLKSLQQC